MTILALDLGTTTGWARQILGSKYITPSDFRIGGNIIHGTVSFKPGRFEGGGMRFLRFSRWLEEAIQGADEVVFEEVRRHAATDAAHVYGGMLAVLTASCEEKGIPYSGIPVGTIKKHATGKGNASKAEMMAVIRAKGYTVQDDNEADAIAILLCAKAG